MTTSFFPDTNNDTDHSITKVNPITVSQYFEDISYEFLHIGSILQIINFMIAFVNQCSLQRNIRQIHNVYWYNMASLEEHSHL